MINDLVINGACVWKYVDDTTYTASEVVGKGEVSSAQIIAELSGLWLTEPNSVMRNAKSFEFLLLEKRQFLSQLGYMVKS